MSQGSESGVQPFPEGGGEAGALMRALDWAKTPLGAVETWSDTLKGVVRMILPAQAQIVVFWGPQFVALYNDAYAPTIGNKHPHALGRPARESWSELWDDLAPLLARARAGETVFAKDRPFQIERKGFLEQVYFDISYSPVRNRDGAVEGVVCIVGETTDRVLGEQRLRASEAQFRTLAQAMPNHAWTASPDGAADWFNERACAYCGLAPGALEGAGWTDIVHPAERATAQARWAAAVASGETFETELRLRRADGTYRWHLLRAVPVRGPDGRIGRWVATNTDIEDQKTERRAVEDQLRQSQKMDSVGQLTSGLAHDFNNLLTGIIGSLDLLRRRIASGRTGDLDRLIQAALVSANRAAGLTQRLLAFSRRQSVDLRSIDVAKLIRSMDELLRRTLDEQIELKIVDSEATWLASGDQNQIESALLNFVINARDAMPDGGTLAIEACNMPVTEAEASRHEGFAPGDYVVMRVSDTGTGMPEDVLARVFDPFFTTKPIGQGTGLGLSTVYGYARQSGGHLRIESAVGAGTTVSLYMPRSREAATEPPPGGARAPSPGKGETVLVVEDDAGVRMMVTEVLRELGYAALEAAEGSAARAILESRQRVDLVVCDVGLPGLNGRQIAELARRHRPGLKVLLMTGYADVARLRDGLIDPGMEMITKPFTPDALAAHIREMIESG